MEAQLKVFQNIFRGKRVLTLKKIFNFRNRRKLDAQEGVRTGDWVGEWARAGPTMR